MQRKLKYYWNKNRKIGKILKMILEVLYIYLAFGLIKGGPYHTNPQKR